MKDIVAFVLILSVCSPAVNATDQVSGLVGAGALDGLEGRGSAAKLMLFGGGDRDQFLGCLTCDAITSDSVCNNLGRHGNSLSATSIWNPLGQYGNQLSRLSPWNVIS